MKALMPVLFAVLLTLPSFAQESGGELATIKERVAAVMRRKKDTPVLIWGDRGVPYGEVVTVMVALQEAGAPSVGLVTENPQ